jgi:ABC-type transporter lipoprotein component MlaA
VGDGYLDPLNYLSEAKYTIGAKAYSQTNSFSLDQGEDYETVKKQIDPYIFVRDFYNQSQLKKIKE